MFLNHHLLLHMVFIGRKLDLGTEPELGLSPIMWYVGIPRNILLTSTSTHTIAFPFTNKIILTLTLTESVNGGGGGELDTEGKTSHQLVHLSMSAILGAVPIMIKLKFFF